MSGHAHAGHVIPFTFTQGGYSGGGMVTGTFEAIGDFSTIGGNNVGTQEVRDFTLSFTGDSIVADFTLSRSNLAGLTYIIGSGFLGEVTAQGPIFQWDKGTGTSPVLGGQVFHRFDRVIGVISTTQEGAVVVQGTPIPDPPPSTSVPEPATMFLLGIGLIAGAAFRKKT